MKSDLFLSEKLILEDAKINQSNNNFNLNSYSKLLKHMKNYLSKQKTCQNV